MLGNTLRATRKREGRAKHREKYHHAAFITEYVQIKCKSLYEEADGFYQELYKRYPNKTKITTCNEFKVWEAAIKKDQETASITTDSCSSTTAPINPSVDDNIPLNIESSTTTTPINPRVDDNIQLNIELMDTDQVQETRDSLVFGDIYPSLIEEINPEIMDQVIHEIQGSGANIFDYDEDINDILNDEINQSMNELSQLEKELLNY